MAWVLGRRAGVHPCGRACPVWRAWSCQQGGNLCSRPCKRLLESLVGLVSPASRTSRPPALGRFGQLSHGWRSRQVTSVTAHHVVTGEIVTPPHPGWKGVLIAAQPTRSSSLTHLSTLSSTLFQDGGWSLAAFLGYSGPAPGPVPTPVESVDMQEVWTMSLPG